jgi:hypothetical protein
MIRRRFTSIDDPRRVPDAQCAARTHARSQVFGSCTVVQVLERSAPAGLREQASIDVLAVAHDLS